MKNRRVIYRDTGTAAAFFARNRKSLAPALPAVGSENAPKPSADDYAFERGDLEKAFKELQTRWGKPDLFMKQKLVMDTLTPIVREKLAKQNIRRLDLTRLENIRDELLGVAPSEPVKHPGPVIPSESALRKTRIFSFRVTGEGLLEFFRGLLFGQERFYLIVRYTNLTGFYRAEFSLSQDPNHDAWTQRGVLPYPIYFQETFAFERFAEWKHEFLNKIKRTGSSLDKWLEHDLTQLSASEEEWDHKMPELSDILPE